MTKIASYNIEAAAALQTTPLNWVAWIEEYSGENLKSPNWRDQLKCFACKSWYCTAWVALVCGGCGKTYWREQSDLQTILLCSSCLSADARRDSWIPELERQFRLPYNRIRRLYEAPEQAILAWCRWRVDNWLIRCRIIKNSYIIAARCSHTVSCWNRGEEISVGPGIDPEKLLDECTQRLKEISLQQVTTKKYYRRRRRK